MKNLIYILLFVMAVIPSCSESPVSSDNTVQPVTINWDSVYFSSNITTYSSGNQGYAYYTIGGGDFSNSSFVRIKFNYISFYKKNYSPPKITISNSSFKAYLKYEKYGTLDTVVSAGIFNGIGLVNVRLIDAKISFDTLMIIKGNMNYQ